MKKIIQKSQGCAPHFVSLSISRVHLHSASTHHSSPVQWVGADTISVLCFCGGFPVSTPARRSPRSRANTHTNSRGVFHGTIPASAGLWSHSVLTTVSSLGQPILASLLPNNGRRNPFLRGPAALQTPYPPSTQRRVCITLLTQRSLVLIPRTRVGGSDNSRGFQCTRVSTCKDALHF